MWRGRLSSFYRNSGCYRYAEIVNGNSHYTGTDGERRLLVEESVTHLGSIIVSESGYIEVPHKNKYGQNYPPVIEDRAIYPPGRNP